VVTTSCSCSSLCFPLHSLLGFSIFLSPMQQFPGMKFPLLKYSGFHFSNWTLKQKVIQMCTRLSCN
jgi:hypothetical protein